MARKKRAVPFEGKETAEEEAAEHKILMRGARRKGRKSKRKMR